MGETFPDDFIEALRDLGSGFFPTFDWFFEPSDIDWDSVPALIKIDLAAGKPSFDSLALEHQLDLLSFPRAGLRQLVAAKLEEQVGTKIKRVLKIVTENPHKFTRAQIVTLISALSYQGPRSEQYVLLWFQTRPDPQMVLNLLMARNSIEHNDFFNLQAARYLADKEWDADFQTLKRMSVHLEPVARALAYSKMDPTKPDQLKFLRTMSNIEPSNVVRKGILDKIRPLEGKSTLTYDPVDE